MAWPKLLLLGAIAGYTIFLGLPIGKIRRISAPWRVAASAASAGILLFLLVEVTQDMIGPIEEKVKDFSTGDLGGLMALSFVALAGIGISLLGLVWLEQQSGKKTKSSPTSTDSTLISIAPDPFNLSLMIAIAIGVHNFAEGLAIGQAAATGAASLASLLIIGFGLHNATEGFGITGPLIGRNPSWRFLLLVGIIGGTPTFLGTVVGRSYTSEVVQVLFLSLAVGSIIYVVQTLVHEGLRSGKPFIFSSGLLVGFLLGIITEMVIVAAGI